jgi:hypothetical protein
MRPPITDSVCCDNCDEEGIDCAICNAAIENGQNVYCSNDENEVHICESCVNKIRKIKK